MRKHFLLMVALSAALCAPKARAQEHSPGLDHQFNFHMGTGFGIPLNPTASYVGLGGVLEVGGGPNLSRHSSIFTEFMWQGARPANGSLVTIANAICNTNGSAKETCSASSITGGNNLFVVSANYMYHAEGRRLGFYTTGGGGWFYRYASLKHVTPTPPTVCQPIWDWWGYACQGGLVTNAAVHSGVNSGGVNISAGITVGSSESFLKLYLETRYLFSPQGGRISTQILPVTLGFRW